MEESGEMGSDAPMRYLVTVGSRNYTVEIGPDAQDGVTVDGVPHQVDMENIDGLSLYSFLLDNRSYELVAEREEGHSFRILLEGEMYTVRVEDERARRLAAAAVRVPSGEVTVKAPMPGLVVDVPIKPGEAVKIGQGLVILEAMKMENELRAPRDGVVKVVRVSPGQVVDKEETLVVIG